MKFLHCSPLTLLCSLCFVATGCLHDVDALSLDEASETLTLTFTLTVEGDGSASTRASGRNYMWGEEYDSEATAYDDVVDCDSLQVAIIDSENRLVTRVSDLKSFQSSTRAYQYYGVISRALLQTGATYRCMVWANCDSVDCSNLDAQAPVFSMSDLPNDTSLTDFPLPMWGVKSFTVAAGEDAEDLGDIWLLKAAAKCRVRLCQALRQSGYVLSNLRLHRYNDTGNILPGNWRLANATTQLGFVRGSELYGFNPVESRVDTTVAFLAEPNATDSSQIVYFPECQNSYAAPIYITLDVIDRNSDTTSYKIDFKDFSKNELLADLGRNHLYDFEITGFNRGLEVKLYADDWEEVEEEWDFTDQISGNLALTWNADSCQHINEENQKITLLKGVAATATFSIQSPVGATWIATLTPSDSFVFLTEDAEGNVQQSATADGDIIAEGPLSTLRILATSTDNTRQNQATLTIYVRYKEGTTRKVEELSGWVVIQTI